MTRTESISKPSSNRAGMVTPTPNAIDSPAEPVVCTMLFSRMVARRKPNAVRERAEQRDRQHGDRHRRRHRHADLEHQVKRRRAEDDAEHGADQHRRHSELRHDGVVGNVGLVSRGRFGLRGHATHPVLGSRNGPSPLASRIGRNKASPELKNAGFGFLSRLGRSTTPLKVRSIRAGAMPALLWHRMTNYQLYAVPGEVRTCPALDDIRKITEFDFGQFAQDGGQRVVPGATVPCSVFRSADPRWLSFRPACD